ncbi:hypothetical protein [Actinacidiphila glaucinigra]
MNEDALRAEQGAHVLHVRVVDRRLPEPRELLALLGDVTPVVQPLPPAAALADVAGATRYWDRTLYELGVRIRTRALGVLGLPVQVGVASFLGGGGDGISPPGPRRHPRRPRQPSRREGFP